MRYMSEITGKFYDTAEECLEAEKKATAAKELAEKKEKELQANRKEAAKEVEAALNEVKEARKVLNEKQKNYQTVLTKFCKTYGSYHYSWHGIDDDPWNAFDFFSLF